MREPWAAVMDLLPACREPVAAALERIGMPIGEARWDQPPESPPALVVVPIDRLQVDEAKAGWVGNGDLAKTTLVVAPEAPTIETLRFQLRTRRLNVLSERVFDDPPCLDRTLRCVIRPEESFEILTLIPHPVIRESFVVNTLAEKHRLSEEVSTLLAPFGADDRSVRDTYLIINELINNAFFHSFVTQSGSEKYSPRGFEQLDDSDVVVLEVAAAEGEVAIAVDDNRGTLEPREVLKYMLRQTSGEGVFDSHGRGFYLISNLVDHVTICLDPEQRTRIATLNHSGIEDPLRTLNFFRVF